MLLALESFDHNRENSSTFQKPISNNNEFSAQETQITKQNRFQTVKSPPMEMTNIFLGTRQA